MKQKARLAITLALVGGFVDAVGFLHVGAFVSNMTGNTAAIGQQVSQAISATDAAQPNQQLQQWSQGWLLMRQAIYFYLLCCAFLLGAALAGLLMEIARRKKWDGIYALPLSVEAFLLLGFVGITTLWQNDQNLAGLSKLAVGSTAALAMGLQNATVCVIAGSVVRTTHVTGVITDLGLETVEFLFWLHDRAWWLRGSARARVRRARRISRLSSRHPTFHRLLLLGSIWSSFLLGATLGAVGYVLLGLGTSAVLLPVALIFILMAWELLRPVAHLGSYDPATRDRVLEEFGLDATLLPKEVGFYGVGISGKRRLRLPDLGKLHLNINSSERVSVLLFVGDIRLQENDLGGLLHSVTKLRDKGKVLIICTSDPVLFDQLSHGQAGQTIGLANLTTDAEFAAARAIEVLNNEQNQ